MSWPQPGWFRNVFGFEEFAGSGAGQFPLVRSQLTVSERGSGEHVLTTNQGQQLWAGRYSQESLGDLLERVKVGVPPLHAFHHVA